jgi:NifU-like protein involved in Fe-S cluster formation
MDEAVIKYYRGLLKNGFTYAGSCENPSIFLDSVGENLPICDQAGRDYLHMYINISNGRIDKVQYLCTCDPTANVVIEILCSLITGKTVEEAKLITEESFCRILGSNNPDLLKKVRGAIELLHRGLARYQYKPC